MKIWKKDTRYIQMLVQFLVYCLLILYKIDVITLRWSILAIKDKWKFERKIPDIQMLVQFLVCCLLTLYKIDVITLRLSILAIKDEWKFERKIPGIFRCLSWLFYLNQFHFDSCRCLNQLLYPHAEVANENQLFLPSRWASSLVDLSSEEIFKIIFEAS